MHKANTITPVRNDNCCRKSLVLLYDLMKNSLICYSLVMPIGICTAGTLRRWSRCDIWSSKKMCGRIISNTRSLEIPPRKKASLTSTPQLLSVFTTRSWAGALRAVTMEIFSFRRYSSSWVMRSISSFWRFEILIRRSANGPGSRGA